MSERNLRKTRVGLVASDKMDKTIVVAVTEHVRHPLYKKIVKRPTSSRPTMKITNATSETRSK